MGVISKSLHSGVLQANPRTNVVVFMCVHDERLIDAYEKSRKLSSQFKNYFYVFVGKGPVAPRKNVIIARDLLDNIEDNPLASAFTMWYAVYKNIDLRRYDYVLFFEYDVLFAKDFLERLVLDAAVIGFKKRVFRGDGMFWRFLTAEIRREYEDTIKQFSNDVCWLATSNAALRVSTFHEYMRWCLPMYESHKELPTIGHFCERMLSLFLVHSKMAYTIQHPLLRHLQLNSHKTQKIDKDWVDFIDQLANNTI